MRRELRGSNATLERGGGSIHLALMRSGSSVCLLEGGALLEMRRTGEGEGSRRRRRRRRKENEEGQVVKKEGRKEVRPWILVKKKKTGKGEGRRSRRKAESRNGNVRKKVN